MRLLLLLIPLLIVSANFAYPHHGCTPNTPENCTSIFDSNAAPSQSGLRPCDGFTFANVIEQPICGMSATEIFIHDGKATSPSVPVIYKDMIIGTIDHGATPTGKPHETWVGIGGQRFNIPFWINFEVSPEGFLIYKNNDYQNKRYDLNGVVSFHDNDESIERMLNNAKIKNKLFHLWK